jgi:hypothetical protein
LSIVERTSDFSTLTVPTRTGRPASCISCDLVDDRVELRALVAVDEVGLVLADHWHVGRDRDDLEAVDLVELLGLGHRRAGHAGELVVEAEVVLEGDRRQRHRLALDVQPLLGLDRLMETLAPAPAGHLAAGELVDDDDLSVLDDVVAVELVERMGPKCLLEVAGEAGVGVVEVLDAEEALHLLDAFLGRRDGLVLEVNEEVAALLLALGPALQPGHEAGERVVQVRRLLGLAADDQRRPGLVDEDVVDLVDDREAPLALDPLVELDDHVVAEVVEAELVVRAVGDVGRVGLAAADRAEVDQALVGRRVAGLEHERFVVGDHPDAHAEEVVDGTHPLRVAPGEVVVDGHDVDAAAGERVEHGGERRDERLALAGLHLGDLSLVEHDAAHDLDVVLAHPQGPLHRLAAHREDFRGDLVEADWIRSFSFFRRAFASSRRRSRSGVVALVVRGLVGLRDLADLLADLVEPLADLVVAERGDLVLELVGLVDDWLEPPQLAVVRVDKTGKELHGGRSIGCLARTPGRSTGPDSAERRVHVVVHPGRRQPAAPASFVDRDAGLMRHRSAAPRDRVELEGNARAVVGHRAVLEDDPAAGEERRRELAERIGAAVAVIPAGRLPETAVGLECGDPRRASPARSAAWYSPTTSASIASGSERSSGDRTTWRPRSGQWLW